MKITGDVLHFIIFIVSYVNRVSKGGVSCVSLPEQIASSETIDDDEKSKSFFRREKRLVQAGPYIVQAEFDIGRGLIYKFR